MLGARDMPDKRTPLDKSIHSNTPMMTESAQVPHSPRPDVRNVADDGTKGTPAVRGSSSTTTE